MSTTQADFKAACERRGLTPSQDLFSFWQDARHAPPIASSAPADERAAFEAWARVACGMPESAALNWNALWTKQTFEGWQAAIAAQQAAPAARLTLAKLNELAATHIKDVCGIERKLKPMEEDHEFIIMCRAIEAAAAPNAALVEALQQVMRPYGIYDVAVSKAGGLQDDFMAVGEQIRAVLASLPVPPKEA